MRTAWIPYQNSGSNHLPFQGPVGGGCWVRGWNVGLERPSSGDASIDVGILRLILVSPAGHVYADGVDRVPWLTFPLRGMTYQAYLYASKPAMFARKYIEFGNQQIQDSDWISSPHTPSLVSSRALMASQFPEPLSLQKIVAINPGLFATRYGTVALRSLAAKMKSLQSSYKVLATWILVCMVKPKSLSLI